MLVVKMNAKTLVTIFMIILLISSLIVPTVIGTSNIISSDEENEEIFFITKSKSSYVPSRIPITINNLYTLLTSKIIFRINNINNSLGSSAVHQNVYGFIEYSDGSWVPNKVIVTITDLNNSESTTVMTFTADSGHTGYYHLDVYDINAENGHIIRINVSYGGCTGNNSIIVNTSQGPAIICNITIYGNLPPAIPDQPSGPISGHTETSYNYSANTTDPNNDNIYYWFNWDDGNNSGWIGPYASGATASASHTWNSPGTYQVKVKAKDTYGAELGTLWSDPLNVTISSPNNPPNTPSNPNPEDGATDVDINAGLSWTCSDPDGDNLTYNVYFEENDPTPDELVSENQTGTTYDPGTMNYDTHYYWQIVAWDEYGASTSGPVWDFTTGSEPNDPPYPPSDPDPADGATGVDINADLSWNCSDPDGDDLTYDVYFEADDPTPDVLVSDDQSETTFDPGTLDYGTTYYWQIIAKDSHSATTEGPVWHFTTEETPVPDLDCAGSLSWNDVEPGSTVAGSFTVKNIGEPESELDWEIIEWPNWGDWEFDPEEGEDLTPEDESITVNVTIIAPDDPNTEFTGEVKVVNKDDPSDNCTIPVYLKTPVNQQSSIVLSALSKNLMTSSLLSMLISTKMLFLQRFSRTIPSNSAAPSSTSTTEDIEDSTPSYSSSSGETQQSSSQDSQSSSSSEPSDSFSSESSDSSEPSDSFSSESSDSSEPSDSFSSLQIDIHSIEIINK